MIQEQGPKTLAAVQERIEAARAREQEALPSVLADVENDGNRGARPSKPAKPFPMPGTSWAWRGNAQAPTPTGPHRVDSLRWFRGCVEAVFAADVLYPGYACAGVEHMMALDAWECVTEPARPSRNPLASIDAAADGQHARVVAGLVEAVAGLHVDEIRALTWLVQQLPGRKLRASCEETTARGWVDRTSKGTGWSATPEELVRSSWLGTWRAVIALVIGPTSAAAGDVARRDREDVLRDERDRRDLGVLVVAVLARVLGWAR